MKKKQLKRTLRVLFLLSCMGVLAIACQQPSAGPGLPEIAQSTVLFDDFSYSGQDDFYANNPLPDLTHFYNPVLPGWYSDPSICTNGEDYFLTVSSFSYFPGVPIFHSKDLVNWRLIGHVLDRPSQLPLDGQHISGGIFAPAIEYNPHNQTYYMVTTNVGAGNFFVKTKDPFGSWSDPIWLPEVRGIDPGFFFDDDGKAYIVNNDEPEMAPEYPGHRALRIQQFDVATDKTFGPRKVLVNKGVRPEEKPIWIEGPHMYKVNGKYYLMSAEGGTGPNHSEVILTGDSPMGTFTPWEENPILTQRHLPPGRPNPITCAGHADLVQTPKGDWWAVFLACRPINNMYENLGRETFLMPVQWTADGYPYLTKGDDVVPMILQKDDIELVANPPRGNFSIIDGFDGTKLSGEWMTLRSAASQLYAVGQPEGYLSLNCAKVSLSEKKTPAFVCRRLHHHKFVSTATMLFDPKTTDEAAGVVLFKDESHYYFMRMQQTANGKAMVLAQRDGSEELVMATKAVDLDTKRVELKVESTGTHFNFYYATEPGKWELLSSNVDARYLSTANAGGFTGTTIGLYATKRGF